VRMLGDPGGESSVIGPRCGVAATAGGPVGSAATSRTPERPARSAAANSGTQVPSAQTTPQPVTTTLCLMAGVVLDFVTGLVAVGLSRNESLDHRCEI